MLLNMSKLKILKIKVSSFICFQLNKEKLSRASILYDNTREKPSYYIGAYGTLYENSFR